VSRGQLNLFLGTPYTATSFDLVLFHFVGIFSGTPYTATAFDEALELCPDVGVGCGII